MTTPSVPREPLNNTELESAILGLRMVLSPEEEAEARETLRGVLRRSTLAVPTRSPVPTTPDGRIQEGANIEFLIIETQDHVTGIPAFTTLTGLQAALKDVPNGVFFTGAQLAGILLDSPHVLFVNGPDVHVETTRDDLAAMVDASQSEAAAQQQAMQDNKPLREALLRLAYHEIAAHREAVVQALVEGFCRIPIAGDQDKGTPCVVLHLQNPNDQTQAQDIPLLTDNGAILCFSDEEARKAWDDSGRQDIVLPGAAIQQMLGATDVKEASLNPGSPGSRMLRMEENRLIVV